MEDDPSVKFIEHHIDNSFRLLMKVYLIKNLYWIETGKNEVRAVAEMALPREGGIESSNIVCLFPPFLDNSSNN
jgi:hypothetical protein